MKGKYEDLFSPIEIDAIGEILNISLGSSATAMSDMLDRRVSITTPHVKIVALEEFEFTSLEPAIGVEITYVSGLEGNNIMLLKRSDIKKILEILMSTEIPDEDFVLDEISLSAVCEVMNQMMGASATALAEFIGESVNISTPVSFEVDDAIDFKYKYFTSEDPMIVVGFNLEIENVISSEFMTLMSISLAKRLISSFGILTGDSDMAMEPQPIPQQAAMSAPATPQSDGGGGDLSQDDISKLIEQMNAEPASAPQSTMPPPQVAQPAMQQPTQNVSPLIQQYAATPPPMQQMQQPMQQMQQPMQQMQQPMQQMQQPMQQMQQPMQRDPKIINVQPMYETFDANGTALSKEQETNLDLIMNVPLKISVEIGRTKKLVKEILEFNQGTLVVLDKLAGDQVDLYVNGQCIAKGDVVVVDDCFGVRITEIIKKSNMLFNNKNQ